MVSFCFCLFWTGLSFFFTTVDITVTEFAEQHMTWSIEALRKPSDSVFWGKSEFRSFLANWRTAAVTCCIIWDGDGEHERMTTTDQRERWDGNQVILPLPSICCHGKAAVKVRTVYVFEWAQVFFALPWISAVVCCRVWSSVCLYVSAVVCVRNIWMQSATEGMFNKKKTNKLDLLQLQSDLNIQGDKWMRLRMVA